LRAALLIVLFAVMLVVGSQGVSAASPATFNGAASAVQNAFVAVQAAGRDGGNISSLVVKLNDALALVQKASAENATAPSQALVDLQSATSLAQGVQSSAATVAQQGTSARQLQLELSVTAAAVIVGIAVAFYVYGDRIYRRLWLRMYRGQVVKKVG